MMTLLYCLLGYLAIGFVITVFEVSRSDKTKPADPQVAGAAAFLVFVLWPFIVLMWLTWLALRIGRVPMSKPKEKSETAKPVEKVIH